MTDPWLEELRLAYVRLIHAGRVTHAENILARSDWLGYVHYGRLVSDRVPDRSARIIDWGGLYGHVTLILRDLGYENVTNYLLHENPYYPLFQEALHIPTGWGKHPNRLELQDESVEVFISSGVLEHVTEDGMGNENAILLEIHRVLKPGGWFFIWNLPARWGSSEILASLAGKWHHSRRYRKPDIRHLLDRSGFQVLELYKHKFLPGTAREWLGRRIDPVRLMGWDDRISRWFPFCLAARDFVAVSRKIQRSAPGG